MLFVCDDLSFVKSYCKAIYSTLLCSSYFLVHYYHDTIFLLYTRSFLKGKHLAFSGCMSVRRATATLIMQTCLYHL